MTGQGQNTLPGLDPPDVDVMIAVGRGHEGTVMAEAHQEGGADVAWKPQRLHKNMGKKTGIAVSIWKRSSSR